MQELDDVDRGAAPPSSNGVPNPICLLSAPVRAVHAEFVTMDKRFLKAGTDPRFRYNHQRIIVIIFHVVLLMLTRFVLQQSLGEEDKSES